MGRLSRGRGIRRIRGGGKTRAAPGFVAESLLELLVGEWCGGSFDCALCASLRMTNLGGVKKSGRALACYPTHDDETVMNEAPKDVGG